MRNTTDRRRARTYRETRLILNAKGIHIENHLDRINDVQLLDEHYLI